MQTATPGASISPHLPVRQDWLDRRREEIIEPGLPIVDPHHHLVDRSETGRYLLPDLLVATGCGHNVTATVYLDWLSMYRAKGPVELRPVGEIEFVNGVASMAASGTYGATRVCAGIVGYAHLARGASVETEATIEAGGGRFRGIRFITASHPDQAALGIAAELGGTGRGLSALYRDLHRRLRPGARDAREQFPQSTRAAAAMRRYGTRSSASPPVAPPPRKWRFSLFADKANKFYRLG